MKQTISPQEEWKRYKRSRARVYLLLVRRTKFNLTAALEEIREMRDTMDIGSSNLDGMPRNPNVNDDAILNAVIAINNRCEQLEERTKEYTRIVTECDEVIASLSSHPTAGICISEHYLRGVPLRTLAKRLNYSESHIYSSIIPSALDEIYDKMPHRFRDQIPQAY